MLGILPVRRKSVGSILGMTAWNLIITAPFVIAYWILTQNIHSNPRRACFGIPWDAANFSRWAFLGFAAYQIFSIRLHMLSLKKSQMKGRESRLTHWMQMADCLHWITNWGLFFYLVTALTYRSQCPDRQMKDLLWSTVFISAGMGLIGAIVGLVALAKFIRRMVKEIAEEARLRSTEGVDVVVAKGGVQPGFKQGGVEILDVRRTNVEEKNRVMPGENNLIRSEYVDKRVVDKGVVDKGQVTGDGLATEMMKKEENNVNRREEIREREVVRERVDPRYMRDERVDVEDALPTNTHNIRSQDIHASQPRKF